MLAILLNLLSYLQLLSVYDGVCAVLFLGIETDTINMIMKLPQEKVSEIKERIISCLNSYKITLRELQSLIGILNFVCQVIVPGRTFSRRLIDATWFNSLIIC
jgi:hypothetical protein